MIHKYSLYIVSKAGYIFHVCVIVISDRGNVDHIH